MITLENVTKIYGNTVHALCDVSLQLYPGQLTAIVGASGCGKSTLMNIISGIDRPTSGNVIVGGTQITRLSENQAAHWRRRGIGIVFQFFQLMPMLTVLENILLPMQYGGTYPNTRRERAFNLLEEVGLSTNIAHRFPSELSGGQQQRTALARALANDPDVLIGDEPTGNLDVVAAGEVFGLLETWAARGKTVIMVTHDPELAAKTSRVITLRDGRVCADTLR
jgi:putative ABC transport system ATP-binding protein